MKLRRVLVLATIPPPYGGQALMVQALVNTKFSDIELLHVPMRFSGSMSSMGKFKWNKMTHMISIVLKAVSLRLKHDVSVLYYVPGGSGAAPVIRDIFILSILNLLYRKVILHFHAAGVCYVVDGLPAVIKHLAQRVYNHAELAIFLSDRNPDRNYFQFRRSITLANGLPDEAKRFHPLFREQRDVPSILFVGVLTETKGVLVLLHAMEILLKKGISVKANLLGEFSSDAFRDLAVEFCGSSIVNDHVSFKGVKLGDEKWKYFVDADIFCFPSFFESESFGNVIVEAMMFSLPVVATHWRGIPDIVEENRTGFLAPVKDAEALAQQLERLIIDDELRKRFGRNGRIKFEENYQLEEFIKKMETTLMEVSSWS